MKTIVLFQDCSNFESAQNSLCGSDQGSIKTQMFIYQQTQDQQNNKNSVELIENQKKNSEPKTKMLINLNRYFHVFSFYHFKVVSSWGSRVLELEFSMKS